MKDIFKVLREKLLLLFSCPITSDSSQPRGLKHPRLPCHSPSPRACSTKFIELVMPSKHLSVVPFSSCLQSFPASGSFLMSQLFTSGGQSFSFNISPSNEHPGLISLGWTGWITLQSKGLSRVFSKTTDQKHQFFSAQLSL